MKRKVFSKIVCTVLCLIIALSVSTTGFAMNKMNKTEKMNAVAHRGYSAAAPENTLSAFRLAGEKGFYGCEFDIQPTKDGVWVVQHDETVDRMTDGHGKISELTYSEISKFKIDAGKNLQSYPNEKIPTLEETLDVCEESSVRPVIEVKGGNPEDMEGLSKILKGRSFSNGYTIIYFTWELLAPLRELLPDAEIWMLAQEVMPSHVRFCKEHKINGISFNYLKNTSLSIALLRTTGIKMIAWTVDNVTSARKLCALGVGAITTNKLLPEDLDMSNLPYKEVFKDAVNDFFGTIKSLFEAAKDYIDGLFEKC
ncbi:MAG: glycerophosphodiester phosphodiesterase family protein [Clostridia bacterium]|nr:glycerophosphodiester phosphodiesterase family protein [Clostridia bacterium]